MRFIIPFFRGGEGAEANGIGAAIAVGRDVFRPDAPQFVELLMQLQSMSEDSCHVIGVLIFFLASPMDPDDTMLPHYLSASWAKVCQAMGPEFEPYLPVVIPPLLQSAAVKADVSIFGKPTHTTPNN